MDANIRALRASSEAKRLGIDNLDNRITGLGHKYHFVKVCADGLIFKDYGPTLLQAKDDCA